MNHSVGTCVYILYLIQSRMSKGSCHVTLYHKKTDYPYGTHMCMFILTTDVSLLIFNSKIDSRQWITHIRICPQKSQAK